MSTVSFPPAGLVVADSVVISDGVMPGLPACWLRRDRLEARLMEATRRKVTILTGIPGSGKTSLVAGWLKSNWPGSVKWLTASSLDTSASLIDLAAEVRPLRRRGKGARMSDHPAGSARLVDHLFEQPSPDLVVIDDIHLISDRQWSAALEHLITDSRSDTKLILIGRHPGVLPLARLGLATEVAEIDGRELEFDLQESAALLSLITGQPVDVDAVRPLVEQTQGWVVALRLSAIQLSQRFSPRGIADDLDTPGGALWQYLEAEVLEQLPEESVDFLVETSIAPEITAELCEAMTGRPDARRLLDGFATERLFVEPVMEGTYLYHPVLREHLSRRLARQGQHAITQAHLKVADWYAQTGDDELAMRHYVRGGAEHSALSLGVAQAIRHLTTGRLPGHRALLPGEIPAFYFAADPLRMYALAASLLCASRLAEAAEWLGRLEISHDDSPGSQWNRARAELLWAIHDSESCDSEGVIAHFERARALLDDSSGRTQIQLSPAWLQPLDNAVMAVVPWLVAKAQADVGQNDDATAVLDRHRHSDRQPGGALALGPLASVALASGRLGEARALACRAIETAEDSAQSTVLRIESHIVLAGVLFEQDSLPEAREELGKARRLAQGSELRHWQFIVDCDSARISLSEGNPNRALRQLHAISEGGLTQAMPSAVALRISQLELRCQLAIGDADRARSILAQMPPAARRSDSLVRISLCAGRPDRAAVELGHAATPARIRDRIEMLLLRARVNLQLGNPRVAEHALDEALEVGRAEHFVRVFLEEPPQVLDALRSLDAHRGDSYINDMLARRSGQSSSKASSHAAMLEPLTERERELVTFLPSHLSQYEIAREMYISANTVKTHIKGLYRKLGATSRSQAVELARSCGLL